LLDALGKVIWKYFNWSFVHYLKVNQVPLKPKLSWTRYPDLHRVLSESRDGLTILYPLKIDSQNIGSNRGLLMLLKAMNDERAKSRLTAEHRIFSKLSVWTATSS
jgi:hypothetical protein